MTLATTNKTGSLSQREFEHHWTICYNWLARQKWQSREWEIAARLYDYLLYRARRRMIPTLVLTGIENEQARKWSRLTKKTMAEARKFLLNERAIEATSEDGRGKFWTYRLLNPKREPLATWKRFESRFVSESDPNTLLMDGDNGAPFHTIDFHSESEAAAQCAVLGGSKSFSGETWQDSEDKS